MLCIKLFKPPLSQAMNEYLHPVKKGCFSVVVAQTLNITIAKPHSNKTVHNMHNSQDSYQSVYIVAFLVILEP